MLTSLAAKSHVCQREVNGRQYLFQCPICIFSQGHAEGRVWKGTAMFLDHVSTHRSKDIHPEVLHRLNIINDYVAGEKEHFDLNLFPPGFDSRGVEGSGDSQTSLSRASTHTSVLDKVWSRKESTASYADPHPHPTMERRPTQTTVRDRADSVVTVGGAEREGKEEAGTFLPDGSVAGTG